MKRLIYPLMAIMLFASCENEPITNEQEALIGTTLKSKKAKVDVCHKGKIINISSNALNAHLKHGDVALIDYDGDGWVEAENECVPGGDCDDTNAEVHPGMEEICDNGLDDNCNGEVDENCGTDEDNDGFTVEEGDCDDTDPSINPGATEICDGIDNDCDGNIDQGDMPVSTLCPETPNVLTTDCFGVEGCKITECEDGWFDVNGIYEDGCESQQESTLQIGDFHAGGIIFYLDDTGQHGYIAAPTDQGEGAYIFDNAELLCDNLVIDGNDNWSLPPQDILDLMYTNLHLAGLGNFSPVTYWSGTAHIYGTVWVQGFDTGGVYYADIDGPAGYVRAVTFF